MDLSARDFTNPFICKILFARSGAAFPVAESDTQQLFSDTDFRDVEFEQIYYSKGKASFSENSDDSRSGTAYSQSLELRIPSGDLKRSERLSKILGTKFIAIGLTTGKWLVMGRNDVFQNVPPRIKTRSAQRSLAVEFRTQTIFPSGFSNIESLPGFPYLIPTQ